MARRSGGRGASEIALLAGGIFGVSGGVGGMAVGALGVGTGSVAGPSEPNPVAPVFPVDGGEPFPAATYPTLNPTAYQPVADLSAVPVVLLIAGLVCLAIFVVLTLIRRRERT